MNSKERFFTTIKFEKPDRVTIDYIGHVKTDEKLMNYLNVVNEKELLEYLKCDFYYLSCRDISQNESFIKVYKGNAIETSGKERKCPFGIRWNRGAFNHKFSVDETISGPLENASSGKDVLTHKWPKPGDFDFSLLIEECEKYADKVIVGGLWTGIMGDSYRMMGFERFLFNMASNPELVKTLIDKVTDVYLDLNNAYFAKLKNQFDIWFFGNDFGSQNGLIISPDMWCDFFYENIKRLVKLAKSYGLKVMMHSCGSIIKIIPFLIDAGVEILDPIQITAKGMEPTKLAQQYRGKIVFHGGIDTQNVLPNGSIEQVEEHALEVINTLGEKGGYIFAPSQVLGPDIPLENILAAYKAAASSS